MELVQSTSKLNAILKTANSRISNFKDFPKSIFSHNPSSFGFIDYALISSSRLFMELIKMSNLADEDGFSFVTIDPDPINYYLNLFGWIPAVSLSRNDEQKRFKEFLLYAPADSIADAVAYRSDKVLIISDNASFAIYGDRRYEIALISSFTNRINIGLGGNMEKLNDILMDIDTAYNHMHLNNLTNITRSDFVKSWESKDVGCANKFLHL